MKVPLVTTLGGFGWRLKDARNVRKLSQKDLGKDVGLPATQISHFETGNRLPNLRNAINLARALDVRLDWLAQDF